MSRVTAAAVSLIPRGLRHADSLHRVGVLAAFLGPPDDKDLG
jgi:hypothetical protein